LRGYNCFKATAVIPVSQTDFRNLRTKNTEETTAKKEDKEKTNFMDNLDAKGNDCNGLVYRNPVIKVQINIGVYQG
jgi:hypothetical protein